MKPKQLLDQIYERLKTQEEQVAPSLMAGELGMLLFLIEYNNYYGIQDDKIEQRVENVFQEFQLENQLTFCNGLTGFGWFINHLRGKSLMDNESSLSILEQLDLHIYNDAIINLKNNNHDFLHGALGNAYYLIPRAKTSPIALNYLTEIIDMLLEEQQELPLGNSWIDEKLTKENKKQTVIMGLAHGVASKIVFFSNLVDKGIEIKQSKKVLLECVEFMNSCKFSNNRLSAYPIYCVNGMPNNKSRLAWCQGDLGIGIALYQAGKILNSKKIVTNAIETCLYTTQRRLPKDTQINDIGLCHGIAGAFYMYDFLFEKTKNTRFKEMADYWLQELLDKSHRSGLSGLTTWDNINKKRIHDLGLLNGLGGVGLALLSHLNREYGWSNCMLIG